MAPQLLQLPEVTRLSSRVIRVLGGNPGKFTLQGTNTYIVGTGRRRLLIDTGEGRPSWIKAIQAVLLAENATIDSTLISHWHGDHVGGVGQLREVYPTVTVHKYHPEGDQLGIVDGETFVVEGATLRAVHSPGHTQDHISLILEEEDAMFTGDNVLGHGTAVFEDLPSYIGSLKRMENMFHGRAYPGHGEVIDNGKSKISEYVRHRQQREDQVLQVIQSPKPPTIGSKSKQKSGWTSMEIVKVIYKDVPENLHPAAHGGILQVLSKLKDEDKVVNDQSGDTWRIYGRAAL